jgi:hypothetical protein
VRVLDGAENPDLAILAHKGFLSLETGLSVVEDLGGDGDGDVVVVMQFPFAPFAVFVGETDIRAGWKELKTELRPFDVHNSNLLLMMKNFA